MRNNLMNDFTSNTVYLIVVKLDENIANKYLLLLCFHDFSFRDLFFGIYISLVQLSRFSLYSNLYNNINNGLDLGEVLFFENMLCSRTVDKT